MNGEQREAEKSALERIEIFSFCGWIQQLIIPISDTNIVDLLNRINDFVLNDQRMSEKAKYQMHVSTIECDSSHMSNEYGKSYNTITVYICTSNSFVSI